MNDYKMTKLELRAIYSLGSIFSLRMLGMFMVLPVLSTYGMTLTSSNETLIGLAIGIYGLTQAMFQIPFGFLSDRIGRKPIIIGGLLIFIIGSIVAACSKSIFGIIVGRGLQGTGSISAAIMALLSDLIREQNRTKAISFIGIIFGFTFAFSMVLGPFLTYKIGMHSLFWITATLAFIGILITLWIVPNKKIDIFNHESKMTKSYFKAVLFNTHLLKLNFSIMCLHALLMFTFLVLPKKLEMSGYSDSEHWKIYLISILIALVSVIPFVIYAEKKHQMKRIFLLCISLLFFAETMFWKANYNFWKLAISLQIFLFSFNLIEALIPSLISKESPVEYKGTAMGIYSTSQFIGLALGGCLGGIIADFFNLNTVFLAGSLLTVIWFLIVRTMKEPQYVISLRIDIPNNFRINKDLKSNLEKQTGVKNVLIIPEERSIYLKIDSKLTNRTELEKFLETKCNLFTINN